MIKKNDITVIIRSAGERTLDACYQLLANIFEKEQIHIIEEVPFSKAVLRSLELGIEEKRPWFACVDADVLVHEEGVLNLLEYADNAPNEVFEIQGLILDKFFPVRRPAGNHLYRTKYAHRALSMIPKEGTTLRPEATLLKNMAQAGYPWMQCDAVVGIHDFEQYYADIFRKCFLQAHKHDYLFQHILDYWLLKSTTDKDFEVANLGALYGFSFKGEIRIDKSFQMDLAYYVFNIIGISEKKHLEDLPVSMVYDEFTNHSSVDGTKKLQNIIYPNHQKEFEINYHSKPSVINQIKHHVKMLLKKKSLISVF